MKYLILITCAIFLVQGVSANSNIRINELWHAYLGHRISDNVLKVKIEEIKNTPTNVISYLRHQKLREVIGENTKGEFIEISNLNNRQALALASEHALYSTKYILSQKAFANLAHAQRKLGEIEIGKKISYDQIKEVIEFQGDRGDFYSGKYQDTLTLYLLCREDRNYPCLFILKDGFGELVREDGKLWSLPALAKSRKNLPYNVTSGQTPMGIHRMDSVMPITNNQQFFGKFRRVILNWVGNVAEEELAKKMLPKAHHKLTWWKQSTIAREVGRSDLRIHGTGNESLPGTTFYPHVPTSGCISTREMKYDGAVYMDQRVILDKLMDTLGMAATYANEVRIKGLLYVINIDDQKRKVTVSDVEEILK